MTGQVQNECIDWIHGYNLGCCIQKLNQFVQMIHGVDFICPKCDLLDMQFDNPKPNVYLATVDVSSKTKRKKKQ